MQNSLGWRTLAIVAVGAALLGGLHWLGLGLPLLALVALGYALVALFAPRLGVAWLDRGLLALRTLLWAQEQGRFHAFGSIALVVEDDGRHVWVDGPGLLRALRRNEPEATLAARHAGHWRRNEQGLLMLRVDVVVQYLATMPGRDDPRVQHLRRYFERELLFPAAKRRERR